MTKKGKRQGVENAEVCRMFLKSQPGIGRCSHGKPETRALLQGMVCFRENGDWGDTDGAQRSLNDGTLHLRRNILATEPRHRTAIEFEGATVAFTTCRLVAGMGDWVREAAACDKEALSDRQWPR